MQRDGAGVSESMAGLSRQQAATSFSAAGRGTEYTGRAESHASALDVQVAGDHYRALVIQPIEYIHANGIPFAEGSVIKYVTRWRARAASRTWRRRGTSSIC